MAQVDSKRNPIAHREKHLKQRQESSLFQEEKSSLDEDEDEEKDEGEKNKLLSIFLGGARHRGVVGRTEFFCMTKEILLYRMSHNSDSQVTTRVFNL